MATNTGETDGNNPVSRSSQNKPQLLEATMRNVPKLKELNYAQWKNIITNSIKRAKLWEYVDGSIEEPAEHDARNLATYYDEAAAVRNAILGSLEPSAQKYIEEALDPRDAWLALEKKYLTAEADTDSKLISIEQQLANLRLDEGGDVIEHIAEFCRMRCQLNGTRLAIDDQTCISMLYRSLPPSYRQSVLTPEGVEMKDFCALCARLTYISQNPTPETPVDDTPPAPVEDYTTWGVPEDIKAFGLTGDKNPLLEERAAVTCRDCLLKDHQAGTPECPQYEWRKELWGAESSDSIPSSGNLGGYFSSEKPLPVNTKRISYEFSEPIKVVLNFNELGLKAQLTQNIHYSQLSAIQQCAILPIIQGRNVLAQAPPNNGKTTALAISLLQGIDPKLPHAQALIFTATSIAATAFQNTINALGSNWSVRCYTCDSGLFAGSTLSQLAKINDHHIFVGTPGDVLTLIRRSIMNLRRLKIVVLDDIDKIIEAGMVDQILEVYRHVPPLAQVIASTTVHSLSISRAIADILTDPLQISVNYNDGMSVGTHFYVMVPPKKKPDVLYAAFLALGVGGLALICRSFNELSEYNWDRTHGFYYLRETHESNTWGGTIQAFNNKLSDIRSKISYYGYYPHNVGDGVSNAILATTDAALSTGRLSGIGAPLVNYDVPSNVEDYIKRLDYWRLADPGRNQMMVTFITTDTDEINIIQDLKRCYGVNVPELLWDEKSKKLC
ncbi:unnamed protein product [Rhizoctonia solani]|uniref:ATP-dependent RNA helicase n=1 Tax=Rhizoctonia solani TaxID=456999 RepID=A0A8H3E3J7_9AGAM|nr:unnamed protein product [Rhizoctonia solani]